MDMTKPLSVDNALLVMLIGMLIVFVGLVILIFLIRLLVKLTEGRRKAAEPVAVTTLPSVSAPPAVQAAEPEEDDGALVAAITAAISCMLGEENGAFTVRRIRRVNNAPAWQRAGREEQIASHF